MTVRQLSRFFDRCSGTGEPLVLASVYETEGSTYSKIGAQMLIAGDGTFQGMLSGGCLEGDLAERASAVINSGKAQAVTYDLGQKDDELWGLGVGCDGLMRIFLQPIGSHTGYQPFPSMRAAYEGAGIQVAATVIASDVSGLPIGAGLVHDGGEIVWTDISERYRRQISRAAHSALDRSRSQRLHIDIDDAGCDVLLAVLKPLPRILILGAGLDAQPVLRLIVELGWRAVVSDHRPAYIENGGFSPADEVRCIAAAEIANEFDLDGFDAAIVMSHHLVSDEAYLRQLAASAVPYVGLLGPASRRDRLLRNLGNDAATLADRLHGPAGLDIHATGPASIAVSIVAEIHRALVKPTDPT